MYPEYCYFDIHRVLSDGKTRTKWKRYNVSEMEQLAKRFIEADSYHIYRSIQLFKNEEHTEGEPHISPLYFDLDSEDNLTIALDDARKVVDYFLYASADEGLNIAFSGNRGFHITVEPELFKASPSKILTLIWRHVAEGISKKLELTTFDRTVYTKRRMWRMLNTKHGKSGLWKIPLEVYELKNLDADGIRELAQNPR